MRATIWSPLFKLLAAVAFIVAISACDVRTAPVADRAGAQQPAPWLTGVPGPPPVSLDQIARDPEGSAGQAIVFHDYRPYMNVPFGARSIDGLNCSIPPEAWDWATVGRTISDVGPGSPTDRVSFAPYNRFLLAANESPLAGICVAAQGSVQAAPDRTRDWALLGPLPARRASSLLEAARWGRTGESATFAIDGSLPDDMFHMNALGWAVVRGNDILVERIMAAHPDNISWCATETWPGSGNPPPVFAATDPLNLAVRAKRADLVALIAQRFSQAACPATRGHGRLYQAALSTALEGRDEPSARALLAHFGPMSREVRSSLAQNLLERGLGNLAAEVQFADAQRDEDMPLVRASDRCEMGAVAFWAEASLARGRRDDLAFAWARFQSHALTIGAVENALGRIDCIAVLDFYRGHGFSVAPDSDLLHQAVDGDRRANGRKASLAEASRFLAVYRRAGGLLTMIRDAPCPPRDPMDDYGGCTAGELARGFAGDGAEPGTVFALLLPANRSRIDRLIQNARRAELLRYMEGPRDEANRAGCLISLRDPGASVRGSACIARGVKPLFEA